MTDTTAIESPAVVQPGSIRWEQDADGIVTLTIDEPDRSANTLTARYLASMTEVLERLAADLDAITGVVLTSAKKTFFAGGDLNELITYRTEDAAAITAKVNTMKAQLRRLETIGIPVVAAINGAALGGGLELALAAHHRIVADVPGAVVGLPEVGLGLLPGMGGIVRTVRMLGIASALNQVLLTGKRFRPAEARKLGLVDDIVVDLANLLPAAKEWIKAAARPVVQPWDQPGYSIPDGAPADAAVAAQLPALPAILRKQLKGSPLPAPRAIMAAAVEGAQVDFESAGLIETRYFVGLATGRVAKNMIKANFFDLQAVNAGANRPAGPARSTVHKVGVIGAGMMGAAIAYVCAKAGIDVVLKDVDPAVAANGKRYSERLLEKAISRGQSTTAEADVLLGRITPTVDPAAFGGVDLVIEAVFESVAVKHRVFGEIQDIVGPDAVLASNTSTLPISELATGVTAPEKFIGIHFFSPVDKMPLVEIIVGNQRSDETLARAFDFARQIGKTPIVVNDSRGFFTSRVIMSFLNEAVAALGEGVEPSTIEQAGLQAGYPAGPLRLLDELTLTLPRKITQEARAAVEDAAGTWHQHGAEPVLDRMVEEFDRKGRSTGAGFYDYGSDGQRTGLWPGLRTAFDSGSDQQPFVDVQERMLFAEAIEAVHCLDEGVLRSVADANVGSLLGIGYPAWTGGVLQYINSYPGGLPGFVARARVLGERYGSHLCPPASLADRAARGEDYA